MIWTAVAIDHWVASPAGRPISLKRWATGWIFCSRHHARPCYQFKTLAAAVRHVESLQ